MLQIFVILRPKQGTPQTLRVIVMSVFHILTLLMFVVFVVLATIVVGTLWRLLRLKVVEAERRLQNTSESK